MYNSMYVRVYVHIVALLENEFTASLFLFLTFNFVQIQLYCFLFPLLFHTVPATVEASVVT